MPSRLKIRTGSVLENDFQSDVCTGLLGSAREFCQAIGIRDDALRAFRSVGFVHARREFFQRNLIVRVRREQSDQSLDKLLPCGRHAYRAISNWRIPASHTIMVAQPTPALRSLRGIATGAEPRIALQSMFPNMQLSLRAIDSQRRDSSLPDLSASPRLANPHPRSDSTACRSR